MNSNKSGYPFAMSEEQAKAFVLKLLGSAAEGKTAEEIDALLRQTDWYKRSQMSIEEWEAECRKLDRWWHSWMPHMKSAKQMRELLKRGPRE